MNRKALFIWIWAAIVICATSNASVRSVAGAELRIGYPSDIKTLDPAGHRDRWTEIILEQIFDGLVSRDASMQLVPEISESWQMVAPQTYEFRLREGVRFHDGRLLTAGDVVFSFDRLIKPGRLGGRSSPRKSLLGPLVSVKAIDPRTVRFQLKSPWPILPAMLTFQQVTASAQAAQIGDEISTKAVAGLVGTGPFHLVQRVPGDAIILKRNEGYFGGPVEMLPVGPACVDQVIVNIVPGNESRVAGLLAGDFDIIVDILPHSIPVIERQATTRIQAVEGTRSFFIVLNNRQPPFDDLRMRQAVAYALDRKEFVRKHLGGEATLINGILSPRAFGKNRRLPAYGHQPDRARNLVAQAGYPDGLDLELDVDRQLFPIADAIGVQLAKVGIRVQAVMSETSQISRKWKGGESEKQGHMWLRSWGNASLQPSGIFDPTHRTGGRGNFAGYSNIDLDALLDTAATEPNPKRRAEIYRRAEAIASRDLPYVYLWVPKDIYGVSSHVSGFAAAPDGRLNLQDVCIDNRN